MPPARTLIIDEDVGNLNIQDLLEAHHIDIVERAKAADVKPGDLAIVPSWQRHGTVEEVLRDVHRRGGRAVLFAAQCDDQMKHQSSHGRAVTGSFCVSHCTDNHCVDVIIGERSLQFRRHQVQLAVHHGRDAGHDIVIDRRSNRVFLAIPYDNLWENRYHYYLMPSLQSKGLTPCLARDDYSKALRDHINDADVVIAGICDVGELAENEEWTFETKSGIRPSLNFNMNVGFEVGVAVGLGKQVALLLPRSCGDRDIPRDFSAFPRIHYRDDLELALEVVRHVQ